MSKTNKTKDKNDNAKSNVQRKYVEYYIDQKGTTTLPIDEVSGKPSIKFGRVEQGHAVKTTVFIKNLTDYDMALEPVFLPVEGDPDLKITEYPKLLKPSSIEPVTIVFAADPDRDRPLATAWDFKKTLIGRI